MKFKKLWLKIVQDQNKKFQIQAVKMTNNMENMRQKKCP